MSQSYAFHLPYAIAPKNHAIAIPDAEEYSDDHTGQRYHPELGWVIDRPHYTLADVPEWLRVGI